MTANASAYVTRRRAMFVGGGAAALALSFRPARATTAPPACVPSSQALAFAVSRNGSAIGTHRLDFTHAGNSCTARIDAAFRVGLSFITLYRYHHQGVETWREGRFQSLETETNDNGTMFHVRAERAPGGILIRATGLPDQLAPPDALPLTHWAIAAMTAPLFNPQTGKILSETAKSQGAGLVRLADGTQIKASRYALAGDAPIDDWYDRANVWAALDGKARDGSAIMYRRI